MAKNSFVAEITIKLNALYTLHSSINSLKSPSMFCTFRHCLELMTAEQGSYLKNEKITNTMHTALFFCFPSGLTFGSELWNIYEKLLGHTDKSFF